MSKRPSGGQRTAAARQESLRERREREGLRRLEVWVPDGSQELIRQVVAETIELWRPNRKLVIPDGSGSQG